MDPVAEEGCETGLSVFVPLSLFLLTPFESVGYGSRGGGGL